MGKQALTDWTATRSGAHITISGIDESTGKRVKLTNVIKIEGELGHVVAHGSDGVETDLV